MNANANNSYRHPTLALLRLAIRTEYRTVSCNGMTVRRMHDLPHGSCLAVLLLLGLTCASQAADWPQYRGANHDGISTDRIMTQWTGSVTNPIWRVVLTNCLGSLSVSGGRVFTQTVRPIAGAPKEMCVALSATNGIELWATPVDDALYPNGGVGYDDGPRTTPAVNDESVIVLSSYLKLYRLNATNGSGIWTQDLRTAYGGAAIDWQNAASPVLEGGLIFLNANSPSSSLMALRVSDGSLAWRSQNEPLTHSTPVLATIQGVRQVIFATGNGLVSLDPASGSLLWKFAYPFIYNISLGASPVVWQDMIFVCGARAYSMGSVVVQATLANSTWTTRQLWWTNNPSAHWMTPVCYQGFLYGNFGIFQFDSVTAQLDCIDMRTGAVKWSTNNFGRGGTVVADNRLLTITEKGQLVLIEPSTNAYTEIARCLAIPNWADFTNKCWNCPAVADGRVYVRSTSYVAAFDLSVPNLKLDPPQVVAPDKLQLTVRTVDGTAMDSNRLSGIEIRSAPDLLQGLYQWLPLTNRLILTNGVARMDKVDAPQPRGFFIVNEPP
jgi:outer membrane protein assembly factor BamB